MLCLVNLPNGTTFGIQCDPKAIGQKCLEEVNIQTFNYFFFFFPFWNGKNSSDSKV